MEEPAKEFLKFLSPSSTRNMPKRIRLVHVSTVHDPRDTRILYRQCRSAANSGFDVHFVCKSPHPNVDLGVTFHSVACGTTRVERVVLGGFRALREAMRLKGDLYHFHDPELIPWMLVLRLGGRRVIYDVHENLAESIVQKAWIPTLVRPVIARLSSTLMRFARHYFEFVLAEDSYVDDYPVGNSMTIVRNFPVLNFPRNRAEALDFLSIVYLGSITKERGIFDLLEAVASCIADGDKIRVTLIGKDHTNGQLSAEIMKLNSTHPGSVVLHDYLPQPEALKLVACSHIGFAVLHDLPNYRSSYPTKIFEYMGCGAAVLTSDFPLYREVVDSCRGGVLVSPGDKKALRDAIQEFSRNHGLALHLGSNGKAAVESRYNWENEWIELFALYSRMTSDPLSLGPK